MSNFIDKKSNIAFLLILGFLFMNTPIFIRRVNLNQTEFLDSDIKKNNNATFSLKIAASEFNPTHIHIDNNWPITAATYDWCYENNSVYYIENCTIDCAISPTGVGILIENSNTNFVIQNCVIYNSNDDTNDTNSSIQLKNTDNGIIRNNTMFNNTNGIDLWGNCDNNIISKNIISHNYRGIYFVDNCAENQILENTLSVNTYGIRTYFYCQKNTICNNTASNNFYGIILYHHSDSNKCSKNFISNNIQGIYLYYKCNDNFIQNNTAVNNFNGGIKIEYKCNNNTILGNNVSDSESGIYLLNDCNHNTAKNNIMQKNECGIFFEDNCKWNNITSNHIIDNSIGIKLIDAVRENNFWSNYIINNTRYGVNIQQSPGACLDNLFYINVFNNPSGINAKDNGWENQWNNSVIGNWWHDYYGEDANNDGIGDTPYLLPSDYGAQDNYPIYTGRTDKNNDNRRKVGINEVWLTLIIIGSIITILNVQYRRKLKK